MRVLHICSYYLGSKLYENLFLNLENLVKNYVYVPVNQNEKKETLNRNVLISKVFTTLDRFFFFRKNKKILLDIEDKVKINEFDLLHAHTLFTNGYVAYKLKEKYDKNYIVAVRNTDINVFFKYFFFLRKLGVKILENSEKIIFISHTAKSEVLKKYIPNYLKKDFEKKSIVVPNGVDNIFLEGEILKENKSRDIKFLFVGDLDKNKNILKLISEVVELNRKGSDANLVIIGNGKFQEKVKQIVKKNEFLDYKGKITDRNKLIEFYNRSKYLVVPSTYETFGLVYAEALSQGCKVIYTKGQGFDGWFSENKVGYKTDIKNLQEILEKAIKNYEPLEKQIIFEVKEKFDWKIIATKYSLLYKECLKDDII